MSRFRQRFLPSLAVGHADLSVTTSFDLVKSPSVEAQQTARRLASLDPAQLKHATFNLRTSLQNETFRRAFLKADGLPALQAIIRRGSGNTLAYALNSLHVLLDQDGGSLSFDSLFLARIVDIVGTSIDANGIFSCVSKVFRASDLSEPTCSSRNTGQCDEAGDGGPLLHDHFGPASPGSLYTVPRPRDPTTCPLSRRRRSHLGRRPRACRLVHRPARQAHQRER